MVNLVEITHLVELLDRFALTPIVDRALSEAGVSREALATGPGFVPYALEAVLLESVARAIGDRHLGARIGNVFDYDRYRACAGYVLAAPTLGDALTRGRRAYPLLHPGSSIVLRERGDHVVVGRRAPLHSMVGHRHLDEGTVPIIRHVIRHFLGPNWTPDWVDIPSPEGRDSTGLEALLGAELRHDAPMPGVAVRLADLATPNPAPPGPERTVTLNELPALMRVAPLETMEDAVREVLRVHLALGDISEDSVARHLSLGARSLQRALTSEGVSFRDIRARVLEERA